MSLKGGSFLRLPMAATDGLLKSMLSNFFRSQSPLCLIELWHVSIKRYGFEMCGFFKMTQAVHKNISEIVLTKLARDFSNFYSGTIEMKKVVLTLVTWSTSFWLSG